MRASFALFFAAILDLNVGLENARAADATATPVYPGTAVVVYWEVNLGGVVWLSIRSPNGKGCAELFWKTYPFFVRKPLGIVCGNSRVDIPGLGQAAIGAALYAKSQSETLQIVGSSQEQVANNFPPLSGW